MSLINQMLKDLEQRGATTTEAQSPSITPQLGVYTNKRTSKSIYIIGVSMVIVAVGYAALSSPAQSARVKETLGISRPVNNDNSNQAVKTEEPKFGQSIQDKISATANVQEATNAPSDQPVKEYSLNTTSAPEPSPAPDNVTAVSSPAKLNEPPANLFERTLKFNPAPSKDQSPKNPDTSPQKKSTQALVQPEKISLAASSIKESAVKEAEVKELAAKEMVAKDTAKVDVEKSPSNKITSPSAPANKQPNIHKKMSPEQTANSNYQQALSYLQQGRVSEAEVYLAKTLEISPAHQEARLTLASLLLDNKRLSDAKDVLNTGLQISPEQNEFRIALARLQVGAGDQTAALNTLEQGLPYAANRADYYAFLATLLQRSGQHEEAITHYTKAIALENNSNSVKANTLVGLGISLQAIGKLENAQQAFIRAQQNGALSPALASFVDQQLKKIHQNLK